MVEVLTPREIEILELVRNGLTIDDVCDKVYVSKRTVSNHLANIFSKLGVTNRQEAIHIAEQLGYFRQIKKLQKMQLFNFCATSCMSLFLKKHKNLLE